MITNSINLYKIIKSTSWNIDMRLPQLFLNVRFLYFTKFYLISVYKHEWRVYEDHIFLKKTVQLSLINIKQIDKRELKPFFLNFHTKWRRIDSSTV